MREEIRSQLKTGRRRVANAKREPGLNGAVVGILPVLHIAKLNLNESFSSWRAHSSPPPTYFRVRAVVLECGEEQTDRQRHRQTYTDTHTAVTNIHFASATPHAKCNYNIDRLRDGGVLPDEACVRAVESKRQQQEQRRDDEHGDD